MLLYRTVSAGLVSAALFLSACTTSSLPQYTNDLTANNSATGCSKDAEFLRQMAITEGNGRGSLLSATCPATAASTRSAS